MPSVKSRAAFTGGKYLVTHPTSRVTRLVVPFVARRVRRRLAGATHADAIPPTRGSRLTTVAGVAFVAGGIVFVVRRAAKRSRSQPEPVATAPVPSAPFPSVAGAPPEARDAPPVSPSAGPGTEAEGGVGDDALAARVQAKLFGGTPPAGVTVESHGGVITLRGRVADEAAEGRFVRDAETIDGVKAVQSELQTAGVEPGPSAS